MKKKIDHLSDLEKSVMLVRMMGGEIRYPREGLPYTQMFVDGKPFGRVFKGLGYSDEDKYLMSVSDLYEVDEYGNPVHMALAWRVLNWFEEQRKVGLSKRAFWNSWGDFEVWMRREPAVAQRRWLDRVLELMIEERGQ